MDIEHKKEVISESQKGKSPSPADSHVHGKLKDVFIILCILAMKHVKLVF